MFVAVCHTSLSLLSYFLLPNSLFVSVKSAPFLTSVNKLEDSGPAEELHHMVYVLGSTFNGVYLASV